LCAGAWFSAGWFAGGANARRPVRCHFEHADGVGLRRADRIGAAGAPAYGGLAHQSTRGAGGGGLCHILAIAGPAGHFGTRAAAQVVSSIGFLGAGIIFRDGLEIHGIITAATLWCSAAVGLISSAGQLLCALLMTGLVMFVKLSRSSPAACA